MTPTTQRFAAAALGLLLGTAACNNDQLVRPAGNVAINPLFDRYVSMGNSITAGFQSGGIDTASNANALTTFFLGGLTQAEMMQRAKPTFVTVWIGNNDVLGAALDTANSGNVAKITPAATFQARYTLLLDSIAAARPAGVLLIGVANVATPADRTGLPPTQPPANGAPFLSYGSTYYALDQANQIPGPFTAAATCAPPRGDSVLVPFPFGGGLINAGATLTCNEAQTIQPSELTAMTTAVAAYNTFISAQATSHGWAYFDPNAALAALRVVPTQVAFFPAFGAACSTN